MTDMKHFTDITYRPIYRHTWDNRYRYIGFADIDIYRPIFNIGRYRYANPGHDPRVLTPTTVAAPPSIRPSQVCTPIWHWYCIFSHITHILQTPNIVHNPPIYLIKVPSKGFLRHTYIRMIFAQVVIKCTQSMKISWKMKNLWRIVQMQSKREKNDLSLTIYQFFKRQIWYFVFDALVQCLDRWEVRSRSRLGPYRCRRSDTSQDSENNNALRGQCSVENEIKVSMVDQVREWMGRVEVRSRWGQGRRVRFTAFPATQTPDGQDSI